MRILILLSIASFAYGQSLPGWNLGSASGQSSNSFQPTLPSGLIMVVRSGTCPSGWTEISALNGKTLVGTLAANGDVGATGGSDTLTPSGTVAAPTFTGSSATVPAQTFTGSSGTIPAQTFTGSGGTVPAQTIAWPAGVATFTGNSGTVPAHTISWPAGVPTFAGSGGTVPAQVFTGSSGTISAHTFTC